MRRALLILLWTAAALGAEPGPAALPGAAPASGTSRPPPGCAIDVPPASPLPPPAAEGTAVDVIDVESGSATLDLNGPASFSDHLLLRRGDQLLGADSASYDRATGDFAARGNVEFRNPDTWVRGDSAEYDAESGRFRIDRAEFDLFTLPARGSAERLSVDTAGKIRLRNVTYSTCARGNDDWLLKAGELTIDRDTGTATAHNARLEFMGVPIVYAPYLSYPVTNQRKTGLLLPNFGTSSQRGLDIDAPVYINLAPSYDATVTPRYMSQRGVQAQGEFRYLTDDSRGILTGEFMPNDNVTGDSRTLLGWVNQTSLPAGWRGTIDATDVSDPTYFEELDSGLATTSQTHLRRRLDLEYYNNVWSLLLRMEDYQTLDEALAPEDRPYRRVPQLAARGYWPRGLLGLAYNFDSEFTYFERNTGTTGLRAHLLPEISLPLQIGGFNLEPDVALDYTRYSLNDQVPGASATPGRTVPVLSVNLATVLERTFGSSGRWLQTVEPRVQFVHVPFEDQSDLPVFDTIEPNFNVVQLFRKNRFAGLDRLSDTDQLNIGVTTRLITSANGSQFLTATVGETLYFTRRDVVLPGELPSNDNASDYIAELGMNFEDRWNLELGYQWDSDRHESRLAEARVLYHPDDYRVVNVSYRFRRDSLEEIDVAGAWPIAEHWSVVGRYDYSLRDREALERFAGVEYSTCCWGVRVVARQHLTNRTGESDTAVTVQLLLKGFGSNGKPAERMLERGILGYDSFDRY